MTALLQDSTEILLRHIRQKHMVDDGTPSSQAFRPMPKDKNRLSLDRSSKVSPEQSYHNFRDRYFESYAVFGVTVGEFNAHEIRCYHDPDELHNPAHSYADFSSFPTRSQQKRVSEKIKNVAIVRGQLFP